jgi:hypothetical protein
VFVSLGGQHAVPMRHIVISVLPDCIIFFSHYLINVMMFEERLLGQNVFLFSLQALSETLFILKRTE